MGSRLPANRLMKLVKRQGIIDNRIGLVNTFSSSEKGTRIRNVDGDDLGGNFIVGKSIIGGKDRIGK